MKRKSAITLGPGAPSLILIFVILTLSMLAMLTLMNSRNDAILSDRSVTVMESVYRLDVQAEQTRAALDELLAGQAAEAQDDSQYLSFVAAQLPQDMQMEGRDIFWVETDGFRNLYCGIRLLPAGSAQREEWIRHSLVSVAMEEAEDTGLVEFD